MKDISVLIRLSQEISTDAKQIKRISFSFFILCILLIIAYFYWLFVIYDSISKVKYPYLCVNPRYYRCEDFTSRVNMEMQYYYCMNQYNIIMKDLVNDKGELCKDHIFHYNESLFERSKKYKDIEYYYD